MEIVRGPGSGLLARPMFESIVVASHASDLPRGSQPCLHKSSERGLVPRALLASSFDRSNDPASRINPAARIKARRPSKKKDASKAGPATKFN